MIRKILPTTIAQEIVGVQPMASSMSSVFTKQLTYQVLEDGWEKTCPAGHVAIMTNVQIAHWIEQQPVHMWKYIDLEKDATIKNVAALYSTVKNALAAHDAIEINAADVATIDTATLQLLVSLKKDALNLGKTVEIIYPSERFLESAKLLGLTEVLGV